MDTTFNVREKADGTSFFIFGDTDSNSLTLTVTSNVGDPSLLLVITGDDLVAFKGTGFEITANAVGYGTVFTDGIYQFSIDDGIALDPITHSEGFSAIITNHVIKDALAYRLHWTKVLKDYILEKMMLLNNLAYAASTGNPDSFMQNLSILQRMR